MIIDNISKEKVLDELFSKLRYGIKPGLERTLSLCQFVNNPQLEFKTIHVAGTNGKGSVCSIASSVLVESGYKTGLYTSPHLVEFNERLRINGIAINDEDIIKYYLKIKNKAEEINATFFEITTVMAFLYFADKEIDVAVIETGMGGRFDSTNVINPLLSVITKIDLDHTEYLGNTIEEICFEKAGIIKPNIKCIVSKNDKIVYDTLAKYSENEQLIFSDDLVNLKISEENSSDEYKLEYEKEDIYLNYPILGKYQTENIKTAFCALKHLKSQFNIDENCIRNGFKNIRQNTGLKARIEVISKKPLIILDGSHNENSIINLFETLGEKYPDTKWNIIFSVMADKNTDNILYYLQKFSDSVTIPSLKIERAISNILLSEKLENFGINNVKTVQNVELAIKQNIEKDNILIFGSFYLIGEALEFLNKM
jgi:dihydrofolate synthase/folylpolyglutamate synthase